MVEYDDVAKSLVLFAQTSLSPYIETINNKSAVARMNIPDAIAGKFQTPLCVIRVSSHEEHIFPDGTEACPKYMNASIVCILLGDTFTIVNKMKGILTAALTRSIRIPLYTFSGTDIPSEVPIGTMLFGGKISCQIPGEIKFPVREVDAMTFTIRVKIR